MVVCYQQHAQFVFIAVLLGGLLVNMCSNCGLLISILFDAMA
jgi:hypothetical protein